jgi:4-amino-4-deoxy-L-arabinose transferase-like glycosyltransferase
MTEIQQASVKAALVLARAQMPAWLLRSALLAALALALVILRCWVAAHMDFETDEAYYWMWSRSLAASYYDHPPMIAYLIRLGTFLFGDSLIGIRSMAILAMIGTSALLYILAALLFGDRRIALVAALWFSVMPHTAFFSVVMFPDTPAILFWLLTCVAAALIWRTGRGYWWYLLGFSAGLLLLSKYTGLFLLFGIAVWLIASKDMRFWLRRGEPYLAALIAAILFSPVLWWNAEHGWVSFIKQFGRGLETSADAGISNLAAFLGVQAAFVSPLIFAFIVAGLAVATWRGVLRQEANWLLLALSAAPTLVYFALHALSAEVLAQWPSAAYPTAIVAAVAAFVAPARRRAASPVVHYGFAAAPWLGLAFTLTLFAQMTIPLIHDPLSRFFGWAQLSFDAGAIMQAHQAGYIATNEHSIGATLRFYLRDAVVFQTSDPIRYDFMPPLDQRLLYRTTGLYLSVAPDDDLERLKTHFDSVEQISTLWRNRNGEAIEPYRVYELKGYRGGVPY